ncbi:MAG: pinensin family lanthipeptide [Cyclobacteriaceae bacterium]
MKKNKLSLSSLKVKSFVTNAKEIDVNTLKGGAAGTHYSGCSFEPCDCPDTITIDDPVEFTVIKATTPRL